MRTFVLIITILNAFAYLWVYFVWKMDCRDIGKENLVVPLKERFGVLFMLATLPYILGILINMLITKE